MPDVVRRPGAELLVALAGNPNVGKSTVFNMLTGMGVTTAHYPGKTIEMNVAETEVGGVRTTMVDLPGAYALGGHAEENWTARRVLLESRPDAVVVVMDATNLARNLYLALQALDMGVPVVVALNLVDEARRAGLEIDETRLAEELGAPVVRTVATQGVGLDRVMLRALAVARRETPSGRAPRYGEDVEDALTPLVLACERLPERPFRLSPRALALQLLEGEEDVDTALGWTQPAAEVRTCARLASAAIARAHEEAVSARMARERHGLAGVVADRCVTRAERKRGFDLWALSTSPVTGIPLLAVMLASLFAFLFFAGDAMSVAFSAAWQATMSPLLQGAVHGLLGTGAFAETLLWGLDAGVEAALAIGLPYILTFYFLLALLEDSGYLNAVTFLADRVMHRFGLHGRAVVPLVAGAGCNVPAILATRVLPNPRERTIASALVVLVPCSARTAVVLGAVAHYIGWGPALGVFGVVAAVGVAAGLGLNALLPGEPGGMVMEMFPFRRPALRSVASKAWVQFREFLKVALPLVVVGSLVLGGLYESGWLWKLAAPLAPIMEGWLGLPAVAGLTLLAGALRKELSLQLLATMAIVAYGSHAADLLAFMTPTNLFVYALVNTLAVPCVSTIAVLGSDLGWRRASGIVAGTVAIALLLGGTFARLLPALGWA